MKKITLFLFIAVIYPFNVHAEYKDKVSIKWEVEAPLTVLGLGIWFTGETAKDYLVPDECRWCAVNSLDEHVRTELKWGNTETAHSLSNWMLAGIPLIAFGPVLYSDYLYTGRNSRWKSMGESSFIMVEALSFSVALNQIVKFSAVRERPYVRNLTEEESSDQRLSFYSGHTSSAFAVASAGAMLYQAKGGEYPGLVWFIAGLAASSVGYFRIAADKHYFTDVATGALLGALIGIGTVKMHDLSLSENEKSQSSLYVIPYDNSVMFGFTMVF